MSSLAPNSPAERFWSKVNKTDGCWLWTGATSRGYGVLNMPGNRHLKAHRFAWELANGRRVPDGLMVLHDCPGRDDRACVRPEHLRVGTTVENARDMIRKGGHWSWSNPENLARGERNGARLHPDRLPRGGRNGSRLHPERVAHGERIRQAKLTAAQVVAIRSRYAGGGVSMARLAAEHGVTERCISLVVQRKTWARVGGGA